MMLSDNRKPAWFFYPGWVALSVISIPIGWSLTWAIVSRIVQVVGGRIQVAGQSHITEDFIGVYVLLPVLGLLLGILQYFLLRRYLPRMGWWIAATVLGWVVPLILLSFLSSVGLYPVLGVDPVWSGALGLTLLLGVPVGLCQWFLLRRRIHRAAWWILASILGWGVAGLISGETISSQLDVIAVALLPPTAASLAWWLLLDRLPPPNLQLADS
ncbi:MAG: hypothetical protein ACM3S0_06620 [Acidobacteriota bacterium]